MIELAILDNNGTIFDDLVDLAYASVVIIFKHFDITPVPTLEQYREGISSDYMKFYYNHGIPLYLTKNDLNPIRERYYNENPGKGKFRPDLVRTVLRLKNIMKLKTAIVSGEIQSVLLDRLMMAEILNLFNGVKAGIHGDKMPALLEMCERLQVQPSKAIYVDDSVDGLDSAQRAGIIPVGFGNGYHSVKRLSAVTKNIIYDLSELPKMIEQLNQGGGH